MILSIELFHGPHDNARCDKRLSDLNQVQDACNDMEFSRNVLNHSLLPNILHSVVISILSFHSSEIILRATWEDSNCDGEASVDHDKEDSHLEEEPASEDGVIKDQRKCPPVHQGRLWLDLLHQLHACFQSNKDCAGSKEIGHCIDYFAHVLVFALIGGGDAEEGNQGGHVDEEDKKADEESPK